MSPGGDNKELSGDAMIDSFALARKAHESERPPRRGDLDAPDRELAARRRQQQRLQASPSKRSRRVRAETIAPAPSSSLSNAKQHQASAPIYRYHDETTTTTTTTRCGLNSISNDANEHWRLPLQLASNNFGAPPPGDRADGGVGGRLQQRVATLRAASCASRQTIAVASCASQRAPPSSLSSIAQQDAAAAVNQQALAWQARYGAAAPLSISCRAPPSAVVERLEAQTNLSRLTTTAEQRKFPLLTHHH